MTRIRSRWARDETGSFIVLWALLLLAVLIMVAIVLDLSALRQDRRRQRLAADSAVTGAGLSLTRTAAGRLGACELAWSYAAQNLGFDNPVPASPCTPYTNASGASDCVVGSAAAATPQFVSGTMGRYTVTITTPVLDTDDLMKADAIGGDKTQPPNSNTGLNDSDGEACTRIGVRISSTREMTFARVMGIRDKTTNAHSVARAAVEEGELRPNLVVLEPHGCDALLVSGTPAIEVVGTSLLRGGIVIVGDGSTCTGQNRYVLDVGTGASEGHVTAAVNGDIYMRAGGGSCTGSACDPGQLDPPGCWNVNPASTTCTGYSPAPLPLLATINRSRIDYLYNCRPTYITPDNYVAVTIDGSPMGPCPNATADYMNVLYKQVVGANGLRPSVTPTPPTGNSNQACPTTITSPVTGPVDFNCTFPNNFPLVVNGDVRFRQNSMSPGALTVNGNAVFDGSLDLGTGNQLEVAGNSFFGGRIRVSGGGVIKLHGQPGAYPATCQPADFIVNIASCVKQSGYTPAGTGTPPTPSAGGAFSFMMGNLEQNGGTVLIDRVMVYASSSSRLDRAGGGSLTWTPPSSGNGPFAKLSFWSDTTRNHVMGGGGDLTVDGVFFAPEALFELGGNSPTIPQDAQFWALKLQGRGTSTFRMTPDPDIISVPVGPVVRLIR